jgi:hypothetical protein
VHFAATATPQARRPYNQAQISLAGIEESNVVPEICHARFVLGFCFLWAGNFDSAEKLIADALQLARRIGDIIVESRCLTNLTIVHRRSGGIGPTQEYAEQSLSLATAARMLEYIGMAKGNLAWVRLRRGDLPAADELAREAVDKLRQTPQGHILLWVALWPLIGVALASAKIDEAIKHIGELLVPPQMAIPLALETELRMAVDSWNTSDAASASFHLDSAAELARAIGYL